MAVKIRLTRMGKIRSPQYRIVVADARVKRDGKVIENLGIYHPKENPSRIEVKSDRVQHWLSVGAQPSEPVKKLLCKTGDWQRFKGLPEPGPLKEAEPKADRDVLYSAAAKEVGVDLTKVDAEQIARQTRGEKKTKKADEKPAESAKTEAKAEEAPAEAAEKTEEKGE